MNPVAFPSYDRKNPGETRSGGWPPWPEEPTSLGASKSGGFLELQGRASTVQRYV